MKLDVNAFLKYPFKVHFLSNKGINERNMRMVNKEKGFKSILLLTPMLFFARYMSESFVFITLFHYTVL